MIKIDIFIFIEHFVPTLKLTTGPPVKKEKKNYDKKQTTKTAK